MENPTINLNIAKTETAPCSLALKVEVLPPRVQKTLSEVIAMFSQQVKIPGFRAGKVPANVILKRFGKDVVLETKKKLIGKAYEDAVKSENINVIGEPQIKESDEYTLDQKTSFNVTFDLETAPVFNLPDYKGLKLTKKAIVISDEQIDNAMAELQERKTQYEKSEQPAAKNDMLRATYTATVPEGVEVTDKSKFILNGTNSWLVLKEPEMLPGMAAALEGATVGEERDVNVTFPESHYNNEVAGKTFSYHVVVNEIHKASVPSLEEVAKSVGCESVEQLRTRISENMKQQAENAEKSSMCHQVEDFLKNAVDFPLPPKTLEAQKNAIAGQNYQAELRRGATKEELEPKKEEMLAAAETEAANQIRLDFTINAIADAEKIEVSQEELLQTINQFAMMQGMKLDEMIRKLQKEGRIMTMMHSIRMQKTLEAIVKLADVTEIA
ncbi:MAG: trigger factor [Victivallales bacterium]|nr:trigger factor [Victivallales bacterium]